MPYQKISRPLPSCRATAQGRSGAPVSSGREQKQLRIADYYLVCGSGLALKDWAFLPCSPLSLEVCKLTSELQFEQRVFHIGARHRLLAGRYGQVAVERRARINKVPGCLCQQVYHPYVRFVNDHQAMDAVFRIWEFVGATVGAAGAVH